MLIQKAFTVERDRPCLTPCCDGTRVSPKAGSHEHHPHGPRFRYSGARYYRSKDDPTRQDCSDPALNRGVGGGRIGGGKSLAEWLRDTALVEARQRPADPVEVVLAEVCATRFMLANLFHATAQAASEGKQLLPETVLKIRETADAQKATKARKLLHDSSVSGKTEAKNGSKP